MTEDRKRPDLLEAYCAGIVSGWQPIETAPKDGTLILIYALGRKEGTRFIEVALWESTEGWSKRDLWFCGTSSHYATHWMPLPAPPTS